MRFVLNQLITKMRILKITLLSILIISINSSLFAQRIPELNKEIVKYVKSVTGKKVDRGECWDLANQALIRVGADWDRAYVYGNRINPLKDQVFPGDLVQFENVKVQYTEGNTTYTEVMTHHTAIVYKVIDQGIYEIAHQNTQFSGRKVGISTLNLNHIVKGQTYFYRPTKELNND